MIQHGYIYCDSCSEKIRIATSKEMAAHEEDLSLEMEMQDEICYECLKNT